MNMSIVYANELLDCSMISTYGGALEAQSRDAIHQLFGHVSPSEGEVGQRFPLLLQSFILVEGVVVFLQPFQCQRHRPHRVGHFTVKIAAVPRLIADLQGAMPFVKESPQLIATVVQDIVALDVTQMIDYNLWKISKYVRFAEIGNVDWMRVRLQEEASLGDIHQLLAAATAVVPLRKRRIKHRTGQNPHVIGTVQFATVHLAKSK